ncbi:hypothetical protein [Stygiolobus sp. RP850M]|uniref:hypothetical protein n=1 Tax=Stygiolobus sp. RP850M TaxID=3133137 RepID=UPI00307D800F
MIIFLNGDGNEYISSYKDRFASLPVDIIIYVPKIKLTDFERILAEVVIGEELRIPMTLKDLYKLFIFEDKVRSSKLMIRYKEDLNSVYVEEDNSSLLSRLLRKNKEYYLPNTAFFYSKSKIIIRRRDKTIIIVSLDGIKHLDKIKERLEELLDRISASKLYIYVDKFDTLNSVIPTIIKSANEKETDDLRIYVKNGNVKLI